MARLRASEPASAHDTAGLPPGQTREFAVATIASTLSYAVYDAYAEVLAGQPGTGDGSDPPRARPLPELSAGPHLAYAVQWLLFTVIAIGGWMVLLRNESLPPSAPRSAGITGRYPAVR
jgi:cytochrome oxidase assembly protein ShyY1